MTGMMSIVPLTALTDTLSEWGGYFATAVASGSISWLTTVRWTRQQAKSDAMKSMQDVYQELMEDLKKDRDAQREENERLMAKIQEYEKRLAEIEKRCEENKRRYIEQEKRILALRPLVCSVIGCPNRKDESIVPQKKKKEATE